MADHAKTDFEDIRQIFREIAEMKKKNDQELAEIQKKNAKELALERKKTEQSFRELQKSLNQANGNFNNKWGTFMENLIQGDVVRLLNERNIQVETIIRNISKARPDKTMIVEFDLVALNGEEIVVVEVKTTLTGSKINAFIKKLEDFKKLVPIYKDKKVYGMVAHLGDYNNAVKEAQEKGLFVIKAPGGVSKLSTIVNSKEFRPRMF